MAVGCPVLAANSTCLPEILDNGGKTFNLDNTDELAKLISNITVDHQYLPKLKTAAKQRSKFFDWGKTARKTIEIYEILM
jgi:glycosyltransferase involved in cell wall biosynthesis